MYAAMLCKLCFSTSSNLIPSLVLTKLCKTQVALRIASVKCISTSSFWWNMCHLFTKIPKQHSIYLLAVDDL